jgi:cytosine/adenosine deaminase-related metal-dependent hydrolase
MKIQKYLFKALLTLEGWLEQAVVTVDSFGKIESIQTYITGETIDERVEGYALPSFQNAHSHAFQYAMAGLAEYHEGQTDDFGVGAMPCMIWLCVFRQKNLKPLRHNYMLKWPAWAILL